MKLWAGRFQKEIDQKTNDFNSSIAFDSRMAQEDIAGSIAHAAMLAQQGILSAADGEAIRDGLAGIAADLRAGTLIIDPQAEDIHTFIEGELTARIGDAGKRLQRQAPPSLHFDATDDALREAEELFGRENVKYQ